MVDMTSREADRCDFTLAVVIQFMPFSEGRGSMYPVKAIDRIKVAHRNSTEMRFRSHNQTFVDQPHQHLSKRKNPHPLECKRRKKVIVIMHKAINSCGLFSACK